MSTDIYLHESTVTPDPADATGKRIATGPLATAALQQLILATNNSTAQASSGTTAIATIAGSAGGVETAIAAVAGVVFHHLRVRNAGVVDGAYSFDGGTTWHDLPAGSILRNDGVHIENRAVQIKRLGASPAEVTGVRVSVW